jgi:hypothetical protein
MEISAVLIISHLLFPAHAGTELRRCLLQILLELAQPYQLICAAGSRVATIAPYRIDRNFKSSVYWEKIAASARKPNRGWQVNHLKS